MKPNFQTLLLCSLDIIGAPRLGTARKTFVRHTVKTLRVRSKKYPHYPLLDYESEALGSNSETDIKANRYARNEPQPSRKTVSKE